MSHSLDWISAAFEWTLSNSWRAALMVVAVLAVQGLARKQMPPRWVFALWFLVPLRLVMPSGMENPWSVYNWIPSAETIREYASLVPRFDTERNDTELLPLHGTLPINELEADSAMPLGRSELFTSESVSVTTLEPAVAPAPRFDPEPPVLRSEVAAPAPAATLPADSPLPPARESWTLNALFKVVPAVWLAGAALLALLMLAANMHLLRGVRRQPVVTDPAALRILERCKAQMQIASPVALIASDLRGGPALFGFLRPRLLVPREFLDPANGNRLRYVILHELAHFKRWDIPVNWIITLLQTLHWFNPVIWYAFYRMRADREVACDALALRYLSEEEVSEYGLTIVSLFESGHRMRAVPGAVGILEDKQHLKRRIAMIAGFSRPRRGWSVAAMCVTCALAFVGLTNAPDQAAAPQDAVPEASEFIPSSATRADVVEVHVAPVQRDPNVISVQVEPVDPPRAGDVVETSIVVQSSESVPREPVEDDLLVVNSPQTYVIEQQVVHRDDVPMLAPLPRPAPVDPDLAEKLARAISLEFPAVMRLSKIAEFIGEETGINVVIDSRAVCPAELIAPGVAPNMEHVAPQDLWEAGFVSDGIVDSIQLKEVSVASALEALLRPMRLDYAIRPGFLFISSPRLLDVEGLIAEIGTQNWQGPGSEREPLAEAFVRSSAVGKPNMVPGGMPHPQLVFPQPGAGRVPGVPQLKPLRESSEADPFGEPLAPALPPLADPPASAIDPPTLPEAKFPDDQPAEPSAPAPPAESVPDSAPRKDHGKAYLEEKLRERISLELEDTHIASVAEQIASYADLNIVVDNRVVRPVRDYDPSATYLTNGFVPHVKLDNTPLGDVLAAVLRPLNLVYKLEPEFIWITSEENARHESFENMETRWYRMDLGLDIDDAKKLIMSELWKDNPPLREPGTGKQLSMAYLAENENAFGIRDVSSRLDEMESEHKLSRLDPFEPKQEYMGYMPYIQKENNLAYGWFFVHKDPATDATNES
ncbi:MAG: hypothetical protein AMXMBFR84_16420 [Candidatus Hydrogenedentota bacterium]